MVPATIVYDAIWDGEVFPVGSHELRAIHIPGHTLGLVALQLDNDYLFGGDSIFINSVARPDLGGKAEHWARLHTRSLRKLMDMPGSMQFLPGHFSSMDEGGDKGLYAATIEKLRSTNDGLKKLHESSDEEFERFLLASLPKFNPDYVEIKRVNAGLVDRPEEDLETLESGKNVCALAQAYAAPTGGQQ
jgi:glyoxylase-like metal-dependent hydrolase (beta-lactamase superfamily II)